MDGYKLSFIHSAKSYFAERSGGSLLTSHLTPVLREYLQQEKNTRIDAVIKTLTLVKN